MKKLVLIFAVTFGLYGFAKAQDVHHVQLTNSSAWQIDHIYISPVGDATWGPDLLGANAILNPGESMDVLALCNLYDVQVIDQDGIACILTNVDICSGSEKWIIGDLTRCGK